MAQASLPSAEASFAAGWEAVLASQSSLSCEDAAAVLQQHASAAERLSSLPFVELLTGKEAGHWQRVANASWRLHSRVASDGPGPSPRRRTAILRDVSFAESPAGRVRSTPRTSVRVRHRRRFSVRREGTAALAELRRLPPRAPFAELPPPPLLHEPTDVSTAAAQLLAAARVAMSRGRRRLARTVTPTAVPGALPGGHPLLLPPESLQPLPLHSVRLGPAAAAVDAAASASSSSAAPSPTALVTEELAHSPAAALSLAQQLGLGFSCGGVSGMITRAVVHPIDTLRVLQSVSTSAASAEIIAESSAEVRARRSQPLAAPFFGARHPPVFFSAPAA